MKQLFILKKDVTPVTSGNAYDISLAKIEAGNIGVIFPIDDKPQFVATAPTGNYVIAYGRPNSVPVTVEIGKNNVVTKSSPQKGTHYKSTLDIPATPEEGADYTLDLVKVGAIKHERNHYTATLRVRKNMTAEKIAEKLAKELSDKMKDTEYALEITSTGGKITVEAKDWQNWHLVAGDDLYGVEVDEKTQKYCPPTGDAEYIKTLASECAQNRGFNNTYADGATIYPGYPMEVDSDEYVLYNIHHQVSREASRTRDEAVWQDVIIAVPSDSAAITTLDTIFGATNTIAASETTNSADSIDESHTLGE